MSVTTDRAATGDARQADQQAPAGSPLGYLPHEWPLTRPERQLRLALRVLAALFVLAAPALVVAAILVDAPAWAEAVFVVSGITDALVAAGLCALAAANLRRHAALTQLLIAGHAGAALAAAGLLVFADLAWPGVLWGALGIDAGIAAGLAALYVRARRAQYGNLTYLWPTELEALAAVAEVVLPRDMAISPLEVALNVDRYIGQFRAHRKWVVKAAAWGLYLYPLRFASGPLRDRFLRDIDRRRVGPKLVRGYLRAAIRLGQQMSFLGYYGDERTFVETGYTKFSDRPRFAEATKDVRPASMRVTTVPHDELPDTLNVDAVVVGSGAAGAVLAHHLAARGQEVLVLERGQHVDPQDFSEDEIKQITTLYADGALQLSRDFSFQVLQGSCVGGTTVVNNAVCFDMPDPVLQRWNAHGAGLDRERLYRSFAEMRRRMHVQPQPPEALYEGAQRFVEGAQALRLHEPPYAMEVVDANVAGCVGSGYCNIGCPFGAKLSMLDTVLPQGQAAFGDKLRIVAECTAEKVRDTADGAVVEARLSNGRRIKVHANEVVISAGTVASSWLLQRSGLGGKRAGTGLSFNMGSPITAEFAEPQRSFDGLQITHYLRPPAGEGYMLETWFNPVVSQALNMPGWLEDHARNMRMYERLAAAGALVGTKPTGRIRRAVTGGPDIVFTPDPADLERLIGALKVVCRIYLAAGAKRVMPNTFRFHEFTDESQLDELDRYVRDAGDLAVGTGHPQGGNALGEDPKRSVVGPDFRVHGTRHVHLCDASVFPSAVTVNPQLTVMALADYAAPLIAGP
jgi:choline dehydrogenase-like flavoprotein